MDLIYLDSNATTPVLPAVWAAMEPYFTSTAGNPASAHRAGRQARKALEDARERIAGLLGAHPDEVIFTSGATEASNLALFSLAGDSPGHIIASPVEHPSVAEPVRRLAAQGFTVDWLSVDAAGTVQHEALQSLVKQETRLVAIQLANHETGTIQPIRELVDLLDGRAACHCDAVQAVGKVPVRFHELGVTSLALSGHKFHGPKGIGALLLQRNHRLRPLHFGGHQQQGRRPGTEPVGLIVGLACALELACAEMAVRDERVRRLREQLLQGLSEQAGPLVLNGPPAGGIPHTLNISFPGCQADLLLMNLDLAGVACSTGSACSSGSLLPSPVLQAMQVPAEVLQSAMRFSLSYLLQEGEVAEAVRRIAGIVKRLRG